MRLAVIYQWSFRPRRGPWDATLGYPGEGWAARVLFGMLLLFALGRPVGAPRPAAPQPPANLALTRTLTPGVLQRRAMLLQWLAMWLRRRHGLSFEVFLAEDPEYIGRVLAGFGQELYDAKAPLGDFAETINAVVDRRRPLRWKLTEAWDLANTWRVIMPGNNRTAMPLAVLLAFVSLALMWDWADVAVNLLVGFFALLRPFELFRLRSDDVLVPSNMLSYVYVALVRVGAPKMKRIGARREHARITQREVIDFLEAYLPLLGGGATKLWQGTQKEFRDCLTCLCRFFGLPYMNVGGITPGSLRPGGATWLYLSTDSTEAVRWAGRWASARMLEIYIQEVTAQTLLTKLPTPAKERILGFAQAAPDLLQRSISALLASSRARSSAPRASASTRIVAEPFCQGRRATNPPPPRAPPDLGDWARGQSRAPLAAAPCETLLPTDVQSEEADSE